MSKITITKDYNIDEIRSLIKNEINITFNTLVTESGLMNYDYNLDNYNLDKLNDILNSISAKCRHAMLQTLIREDGVDIKNESELDEFYDEAVEYRLIAIAANITQKAKIGSGPLASHFNAQESKKYFSNAHKTKDICLRLQQYLFNLPYSEELANSGEINLFNENTEINVIYGIYTLTYDHGNWELSNLDGYKFTITKPNEWTVDAYKRQLFVIYSMLLTSSTYYANDQNDNFVNFLNKLLSVNIKGIDFAQLVDSTIEKITTEILTKVNNLRNSAANNATNESQNEGELKND